MNIEERKKVLLDKMVKRTIMKDENKSGTGTQMKTWQWGEGVALFGIVKAYEVLGDEDYIEFVKNWIDHHLENSNIGKSINTTAPLLGILKLLEMTKEEKYYKICDDFANWCMNDAPRATEDAFEHSCTENIYPNQIWADTLFMGCIFLAKWGIYTGEVKYIKEAVKQFLLHYKYLSDEKTGLIYHGFYGNEGIKKGVLWGRGNGWFSAASVELISLLKETFPGRDKVIDNFKKHSNGLINLQDESGLWHTVLDRNDTYLETTATAAFAYALEKACEEGVLGIEYKQYADLAAEAIMNNVNEKGELTNASGGTCVMESALNYNKIPYNFSWFAQGLGLMALSNIYGG